MLKLRLRSVSSVAIILLNFCCSQQKQEDVALKNEVKNLGLESGEIALCRSDNSQFGKVNFSLACADNVRKDFDIAVALLHSFEYAEAEKMFSGIISKDPHCVMAYWGAAMCNYHPLWEPPTDHDLAKGERVVGLARTLVDDKTSRESLYLEAIATIFDQWKTIPLRSRTEKFEAATGEVYARFPDDHEAGIFHALAMRAAADPRDKTFSRQKKAGEILNGILAKEPDHPGIAHYIIHVYDYPELATLGLPSARKYASVAAASAHAQHMPSHIFTRLGLWDESISSNSQSVDAARCYAETSGMKGHWDEELHGIDYMIYAYLQAADDLRAKAQVDYLDSIDAVFPQNFKGAYAFTIVPARYVLERKDWKAAASLSTGKGWFPWNNYHWEQSGNHLARALGNVHLRNIAAAKDELAQLTAAHQKLVDARENYKATLVRIQMLTADAWIKFAEHDINSAVTLMTSAADLEDQTDKHPVTPGPVIPARELLGDLYAEMNNWPKALDAYETDLVRQPNRFNGVYGAAHAADKSGSRAKALEYYQQLIRLSKSGSSSRPEVDEARKYVGTSMR